MQEPPKKNKRKRDYKPHDFPVLERKEGDPINYTLLLALYDQTCQSWRTLLDIRFKLLAAVPTVSFILIAGLLSSSDKLKIVPRPFLIVLANLGLIVTFGLFLYERRNSELYIDLGSRARRIESGLGVHTGQFLGRLDPQNLVVDHQFAICLIYLSALAMWIATGIALPCLGS